MAPKLSGQNCKFLTFPLSLNSQKRLGYKENNARFRSLPWKPRSHVRILIYRTWPIGSLRNYDAGTATTTPQINDMIGWMRKNNRAACAACAARFLVHSSLFGAFVLRSLSNDKVKVSYLRFWRQQEPAAVNLSFSALTWKPFVPSKRKCISPIL